MTIGLGGIPGGDDFALEAGGMTRFAGRQAVSGPGVRAAEEERKRTEQALQQIESAGLPSPKSLVKGMEAGTEEWVAKVKTYQTLSNQMLKGRGGAQLKAIIEGQEKDTSRLLVKWAELAKERTDLSLAEQALGLIRPIVYRGAFRVAAGTEIAAGIPIAFGDTSEQAQWNQTFAHHLYLSAHLLNLTTAIGSGSTLLARALMLRSSKQLLEELKKTRKRRPDLEGPLSVLVEALGPAIRNEEKAIRGEAQNWALSGTVATAGAVRAFIGVSQALSGPLGVGLDAAGAGILIIGGLIGIRYMEKEAKEQKEYAAEVRPSGPLIPRGTGPNFWRNLQNRRRAIAEARADVLEEKGQPIKSRQEKLAEIETRNVMTRKALKSLIALKHESILGRHRSELRGDKLRLSVASIAVSLSLVLKILLLTGVFLAPTVIFLVPGLVFLGVAAAIAIAGLYYYYRSRPNLLKSLLKGHGVKKVWHELNLSFAKVRLRRAELRAQETNQMIHAIGVSREELDALLKGIPQAGEQIALLGGPQVVQVELEKAKEALDLREIKLRKKREELVGRIKKLDAARKVHLQQATSLQEKIEKAAWKDFIRRINKPNTTTQNHQPAEAQAILEDIVRGLTMDPALLDKQTQQILKSEMNIDLEAIRQHTQGKEFQEVLEKELKRFFALGRAGMLKLGRIQKGAGS